MTTGIEINNNTDFKEVLSLSWLASSAYMGHKVLDSNGKQISYWTLKAAADKDVNVHVGGDYYNRIFTILDKMDNDKKFKVYKVGRKSGRRSILRRDLSEAEAKQVVRSYPNSNRSMVCYTAQ